MAEKLQLPRARRHERTRKTGPLGPLPRVLFEGDETLRHNAGSCPLLTRLKYLQQEEFGRTAQQCNRPCLSQLDE